jgi:hypothetical protein
MQEAVTYGVEPGTIPDDYEEFMGRLRDHFRGVEEHFRLRCQEQIRREGGRISEQKISPCWFCGGECYVQPCSFPGTEYGIRCKACYRFSLTALSEAEAIEAHNNPPGVQALRDEIKRLKAEIERGSQ